MHLFRCKWLYILFCDEYSHGDINWVKGNETKWLIDNCNVILCMKRIILAILAYQPILLFLTSFSTLFSQETLFCVVSIEYWIGIIAKVFSPKTERDFSCLFGSCIQLIEKTIFHLKNSKSFFWPISCFFVWFAIVVHSLINLQRMNLMCGACSNQLIFTLTAYT